MTEDILGKYKLVLGMEIHLHVYTTRKMFCRCSSEIYQKEPNTNTCPVCLGLPGALPVPNFEAIRKIQLLGLALNCKLNKHSRFDRKHYFYPDLPKGYQISQYKQPFCIDGLVELSNGKKAEIERIHLEEDTAKSTHEKDKTLIDFNMSGMPLIEIVTRPIFTSISDAVEFCKHVQKTVREFGLGDVDMEKGQMRLEPNISLRTEEMEKVNALPTYKVEIKNINSFKFMEKAVTAEIIRQRGLLEQGIKPLQENRGYVEETHSTVSQRSKEDAHDYRYFPEPDIPPMEFDKDYILFLMDEYERLRKETPSVKKAELLTKLDIQKELKARIIDSLDMEEVKKLTFLVAKKYDLTTVVNSFLNKKDFRYLTEKEMEATLSANSDKVEDLNILTAEAIKVIDSSPEVVASYKSGKENALQFLIGMMMKATQGKADAVKAKEVLVSELNKKS